MFGHKKITTAINNFVYYLVHIFVEYLRITRFIDCQARSKNTIIFNVHEQFNYDNNTSDVDPVTHIFDKLEKDISQSKSIV